MRVVCESECSNGKKTANNILKQTITHGVGSFLIVRGDLGTTGTGDSDMDVAGIGDSDICFMLVVCCLLLLVFVLCRCARQSN